LRPVARLLAPAFGAPPLLQNPSDNPPGQGQPEVDAIVEAIVYLYTESRRLTKDIAARHGLTGPQLTVVKILEALGDLSLSRLSAKIKAQNSTVTGIVDRMEREGLVVRERSASDRRVVHIRLTPKGSQLAREVPIEPIMILRNVLEGLSENEKSDLLRILTKLAAAVRVTVDTGSDIPG
jgi:DNA-binding MarR family transcriptional regulator